MSLADLRLIKGLKGSDQLFDRAGPLELSANDFQMNLAANVIKKEQIRGEDRAISRNREVAKHVRGTIAASGGTLPDNFPLEEPIRNVEKRIKGKQRQIGPSDPST